MMKLSFSLNAKPKAPQQAPPLKRPAAFGDGDEDVADAAPTSTSVNSNVTANKKLLAQNVKTTKVMKKRLEAEKKVDPSVYEYDEVYDQMQEAKQRQKEAKEQDAKERKVHYSQYIHGQQSNITVQPKYIEGLLTAAATRRLDHLRAEEKMMQREREAEGDMYKDKEAFVTQAYKDQMEEVRKAEEEERRRDGMLNYRLLN
jgi:coiled-coil domain-containing protein 55